MAILHLTTFLQGGAGLVIAALAAEQRRAGHEVVLVTSATSEPGYGNYPGHLATLHAAGVEVHLVDSLFKRELADNLDVVTFVERHGGAARFDVMHAHAAIPSVIALILAGRAARRVPTLQTMHGWGIAKSPQQHRADVAVLNLVDRVVVPAKSSAALLESFGVAAERVQVIPWAVGPRPARDCAPHPVEAEMREWQRRGGEVACCVGTIGQRKNQRLLLEALPRLDPEHALLCVFVGDGEATELAALAERLGVAERVRLCGYRQDARHIAAAADYLVLPSFNEGQPIAVLEAFCDGVPVLGSAIPEIKEMIDDGVTGLLFDPRDATDLARALSVVHRLTSQARAGLVARARTAAEASFSVAGMHQRYLAAYDELR